MNSKDRLFDCLRTPEPFSFNDAVATVFPDMIQRSVPGYDFSLSLIEQIAKYYVQENSNVYDLGCSLGAIILSLRSGVLKSGKSCSVSIYGVDSSSAMIERAKENIACFSSDIPTFLECNDILDTKVENASIVVLAYTLQFINPDVRLSLLNKIYNGLLPNGVFILVEKVHETNFEMQKVVTELHHEFKRINGYSELEISQKRQALENVLITESVVDHERRLNSAGFDNYCLLAKHHAFSFWFAKKI